MRIPEVGADQMAKDLGSDSGRASKVTVVVPTRNSARTIEQCLLSLRNQTYPCNVVVVDNFSNDATPTIAAAIADSFFQAGPERSRQRNLGAASSDCSIVGFVDSDMSLEPEVVSQVVGAIESGSCAVTIPERSVGSGFWARVRAAERTFYDGLEDVEAPRFFLRSDFEAVGGFDEALNAAEDWDLAIRMRPRGSVARTRGQILHDEGSPTFLGCCRKKGNYAAGIRQFTAKHGFAALRRSGRRPYFRRPWVLSSVGPAMAAGIIFLKLGEAAAVAIGLVHTIGKQPMPSESQIPQPLDASKSK